MPWLTTGALAKAIGLMATANRAAAMRVLVFMVFSFFGVEGGLRMFSTACDAAAPLHRAQLNLP